MKEKKIAESVEVWVSEKVTYYGVIDVEYDGDSLTDDDVRNAVHKIDEEQKEFFEPVDGENFGLVEYRHKNVGSGDLS